LSLFRQVYSGKKVPVELLQTSVPRGSGSSFFDDVMPQKNGFVRTVIEAYNQHRALIIRPDDVWLAILVQFNFFVNGNAELLREHFVSHAGKEKLVVEAIGNRNTVDFATMSRQMTKLMETKVVDPDLRNWILPSFSTTTITDTTIYAMVMMASLKEYFSYGFTLACGIPQVTLEGTRDDWTAILSRLEKLKEYGNESNSWYRLLRPIISRFVAAYDDPHGAENLDFWNKVAHIEGGGSGPRYLAGWITAFCYFSVKGSQTASDGSGLVLDDVTYPMINTNKIPSGYGEVDVELDDNGTKFNTTIVAGSIGSQICVGRNVVRNTVRPLSAWWYLIMDTSEVKNSSFRAGRRGGDL